MTAQPVFTPPPGWKTLKLSAKVFGHISQGLYRTPAGAIKELISNAFDADARHVKIHTDFPKFSTFSCEDDGDGISVDEFEQMMDRGFGTSTKRSETGQVSKRLRRPLIGRLGIGLLSMAQICAEFKIVSHHRASRKAFEVIIRFPPYTKEELDRADKQPGGYMIGGAYKFADLSFSATNGGVKIYTSNLRPTFCRRMQALEKRFAKKEYLNQDGPYLSFGEFVNCIYNSKTISLSLTLASDYDQLLFGLASAAPVPYFESGDGNIILKAPFMQRVQRRLKGYKFMVEVDNLRLAKPLILPSIREAITSKQCKLLRGTSHQFRLRDGPFEEDVTINKSAIAVTSQEKEYALYELKYFNKLVGGRPLRISGYMFNQTGRLYPREIQGVLIRIKNVAIGSYDNSLMYYPRAEGPRFSMVSMEIFVEQGFEDALNIDRDSFNGLDPHYMRVQAFIHSMMETIFPEIWTEEKERNRRHREQLKKASERKFLSVLSRISAGSPLKRLVLKQPQQNISERDTPVEFSTGVVEIVSSHPLLEPLLKRHKHRTVAAQVAIALERALQEQNDFDRRRVFYQLLSEIFSA